MPAKYSKLWNTTSWNFKELHLPCSLAFKHRGGIQLRWLHSTRSPTQVNRHGDPASQHRIAVGGLPDMEQLFWDRNATKRVLIIFYSVSIIILFFCYKSLWDFYEGQHINLIINNSNRYFIVGKLFSHISEVQGEFINVDWNTSRFKPTIFVEVQDTLSSNYHVSQHHLSSIDRMFVLNYPKILPSWLVALSSLNFVLTGGFKKEFKSNQMYLAI